MERSDYTTTHLSIAVLDDQTLLWRLLTVLAEHGVSSSQCSLWALPANMVNLEVPASIDEPYRSDLETLLAGDDNDIMLVSGVFLAARSGTLFDRLLRGTETHPPHWMHMELRGKLADQAADGGVVLLVNATGPGQHALAARLLLSHGSHDLHTHEFSLRD